ncbi:MAG: hypothetical protein U9Q81_26875 [Pseudomonadota bacterium]|nr:hypothetical protein [Pseudomonadota bacterium]
MKLKDRNGILLPAKMKVGSWVVLGPPGAGKSHLVHQIGGWPDEVCIDISMEKWWAVEALTHRPREIHLALPFNGFEEGLSVYDERWKGAGELPAVDFERIRIPHKKKFILAPNWRARFVFDFILPPPGWLLEKRRERLSTDDVRLVDMDLTEEWITWQIHTHWRIASYFFQAGLQVMLRPFNTVRPYSLPVLKKIVKKATKPCDEEITPALDWSKVRCVKRWVTEVSPKDEETATDVAIGNHENRETEAPDGTPFPREAGFQAGRTGLSLSFLRQLLAIEAGDMAGRMPNWRK